MPNDSKKLSGAEEYIAAEIELSATLDPEQEKKLRSEVEKMNPHALDSWTIAPNKVSFCYDPARTSKNEILQLIQQAGGKCQGIEMEGSPLL